MGEEDRWAKLEQIVDRVINAALDARGIKAKTNIRFSGGRWTGVTPEQLSAWREAYGSVDIDEELKRAAAWIVSNPNLAPRSQFARFLNTWFSRTQDRSSIRSIPMLSERTKTCSYCTRPSSGSVNGYQHCREHLENALASERPEKSA